MSVESYTGTTAECRGNMYQPGYYYHVPLTLNCPSGYVAANDSCWLITQSSDPCQCNGGDPGAGDANPSVADPIILSTGDVIEVARDFESAGSNHAFSFGRMYSYQNTSMSLYVVDGIAGSSSSFGFNWSSVLDRILVFNAPYANVYLEGGRYYGFNQSGSTFTARTGGRIDTLVQNSSTSWTWTSASGEKTSFSQPTSGGPILVASITEIGGHTLTFSYNSSNLLQTITDEFGRTATFTWNSTGQVTQIAFPDSVTLTYNYNPITSWFGMPGRLLTSVTRTQGGVSRTISYKYEDSADPQALTGLIDERGIRTATWTYDEPNARATSATGAGTVDQYTVSYDDTLHTRTVTNPLGKQFVYKFQGVSGSQVEAEVDGLASTNTPATTRTQTYSTAGYIASVTDENGSVTRYTQNSAGFETSRTEAYGTTAARTINTTWSSTLPLPTEIAEPGRTTDYVYNSVGNVTQITVTDTTSYSSPYVTNGRTRSWSYTYTPEGLLHTVTDPLSHTTTYSYNSSGFLSTVSDPITHVTQITAWNGRGEPLTMVDPNTVATTFTYDLDGRPLTVTINPGSTQSEYQFGYTNAGDISQITLPGGGYLQYTYDDARRVTRIADNSGNEEDYSYDSGDNRLSTTIKNASGTITKTESATYDELNRILTAVGAGAQTWHFGYDAAGNLTSDTDPLSHIRQTAFDPLNRIISKTDPLSHSTQYARDGRDNMTQFTDGRSLSTAFEVDGFGEIIREVSPDRGTRQYWYDAAGNVTKWIDGDGEETDFAYDADNRLTAKTFPSASAENIAFSYDDTTGGNPGIGRLTNVSDEPGSTQLVYNAQGQLAQYNKVIWGRTYSLSYGYDANGKVVQITYPSGRIVNVARDSRGVVTGITTQLNSGAGAQNVATALIYDPFGPLTSLTYGNGLGLTRTYDQDYQLTRIQVNATGVAPLDLGFQWYNDGRLGEVDDYGASGRTTYISYANDGRLSYAAGPWGQETYTYDAVGNRTGDYLTVAGVTTTDNEITSGSNNHLTQTQDGSGSVLRNLSYRAGGDLYQDQHVGGTTYTYLYNARKRLVEVEVGGSAVGQYAYDAFERRVARQTFGTGAVVTEYVFDPDGHLLAEYDGSTGNVLKEYIWLGELPLAVVDSTSGTPATYYIHTGQIGEPLELTDSGQNIVWNGYSNPYGKAQTFSAPSEAIDLRLPGQWLQIETNSLHQNGRRDYDPSLGRYIEGDPLGIEPSQNIYAYVDGDPLNYSDPLGLAKFDPNSDYCKALRKTIANLQKEVLDRWNEYDEDRLNLPERIGPGEQLRSTRRGHRTLITKYDFALRDAQRRYDRDCGGGPPQCPKPAPQPSPSSQPSPSPSPGPTSSGPNMWGWFAAGAAGLLLFSATVAANAD
jgi:RHS repeat-associated protein